MPNCPCYLWFTSRLLDHVVQAFTLHLTLSSTNFIACAGPSVLPKYFHLLSHSQVSFFFFFFVFNYGLPFSLHLFTLPFQDFGTHSSFNSFHYSSRTFLEELLVLLFSPHIKVTIINIWGYGFPRLLLSVWMQMNFYNPVWGHTKHVTI